MRDWRKFAWKKGDVLERNGDVENPVSCIFVKWENDEYTKFIAKYVYRDNEFCDELVTLRTTDFYASNATDSFMESLEKNYGGNLNPETLEIDKIEKRPYYEAGTYFYFENQNQTTFVAQLVEEDEQGRLRFGEHIIWNSYKEGWENARYYGADKWMNGFVVKTLLHNLRPASSIEIDTLKMLRQKARKNVSSRRSKKFLCVMKIKRFGNLLCSLESLITNLIRISVYRLKRAKQWASSSVSHTRATRLTHTPSVKSCPSRYHGK